MMARPCTITPSNRTRRRTRSRTEEDGLQNPLEENVIEENRTFTPADLLLFQNGDGTPGRIRLVLVVEVPYDLQRYRIGASEGDCDPMKPAAEEHEGALQPAVRVRSKRLNRTTQAIPEPGAFQAALPLDGYPAPDPDDTRAHREIGYELAREVIEQARIAERAKQRLMDPDLERYQARSLRRGPGVPSRPGGALAENTLVVYTPAADLLDQCQNRHHDEGENPRVVETATERSRTESTRADLT